MKNKSSIEIANQAIKYVKGNQQQLYQSLAFSFAGKGMICFLVWIKTVYQMW